MIGLLWLVNIESGLMFLVSLFCLFCLGVDLFVDEVLVLVFLLVIFVKSLVD